MASVSGLQTLSTRVFINRKHLSMKASTAAGFSAVGGAFYLNDADYRLSAPRDEIWPNIESREPGRSLRAYKLLPGGAISTPVSALLALFIISCCELRGQLFFWIVSRRIKRSA